MKRGENGEDGVPAVKGAPPRKTARHKLAVGILIGRALRQVGRFRQGVNAPAFVLRGSEKEERVGERA
jgi:hypothetical protein